MVMKNTSRNKFAVLLIVNEICSLAYQLKSTTSCRHFIHLSAAASINNENNDDQYSGKPMRSTDSLKSSILATTVSMTLTVPALAVAVSGVDNNDANSEPDGNPKNIRGFLATNSIGNSFR